MRSLSGVAATKWSTSIEVCEKWQHCLNKCCPLVLEKSTYNHKVLPLSSVLPLRFANKDIHKFITPGCLQPLYSAPVSCLEIQWESKGAGRALFWSSVLPGLLPSSSLLRPARPTQPLPSRSRSVSPRTHSWGAHSPASIRCEEGWRRRRHPGRSTWQEGKVKTSLAALGCLWRWPSHPPLLSWSNTKSLRKHVKARLGLSPALLHLLQEKTRWCGAPKPCVGRAVRIPVSWGGTQVLEVRTTCQRYHTWDSPLCSCVEPTPNIKELSAILKHRF